MKKLEALFNSVIIKPIENQETTYGNLIVPDTDRQGNEIGEIVAIGPGSFTITGDFIHTSRQEGDIVILPTMGFTKFSFEGETYFVGKENELLGMISEINETDKNDDLPF